MLKKKKRGSSISMRHRKSGIKLNRTSSHRDAMFRNMVTSLFKYDRIHTTDVKAKELRRWADRIITLAKRGDLHARRQVMAIVREKAVVHALFESASARFGNLNGGYTRIIKIGRRPGDAAPVSLIELVSLEAAPKKTKKKAKPAVAEPEKIKTAPAEKSADAPAPPEAAAPEAAETEAAPAEAVTEAAPAESAEPAAEKEEVEAASAQEEPAAAEPPPAEESPAKKEDE
jgi:large subunit ribosomal protein L17